MKTSTGREDITSEYRARCNRLIQADRLVIASNICLEGRPPEMIEAIRAIKLVLFGSRLDSKQLYARLFEANALLVACIDDPRNKLFANDFTPEVIFLVRAELAADPRYIELYKNEDGVIDSRLYGAA